MSGAEDLPNNHHDEIEELIGDYDPEIEGSERWTVGDVARFIADPGPWADILKVKAVKERETAQLIKREEEWLHVKDEARKRHERKTRPTADPPSPASLTELLEEPDEEVQYLVSGLWPKQGRIVLAAQNKTGKSTLVGNLIRSLVDGDDFLGRFPTERAERVVLLDNELSRRMVRQWLREQGILKTDAVTVYTLKGALSSFNILDPEVRQEWAERIGPADVLLFDCLRPVLDSLGLSEDKDAGRFLVAFDELLAASTIPDAGVVHHMGHSNERSRGDSRIEDWPDAKWKLVKEDADDPDSPRYFSAFGRDVEQGEVRLHFNAENRHLTIDGGSRRQATASRIEDNVLLYISARAAWAGDLTRMSMRRLPDRRNESRCPSPDVASGRQVDHLRFSPSHTRPTARLPVAGRGDDMRAVGYVRISKADRDKTEQEQRLSLRQQEAEVREACEARGWDLFRIMEDFALSGNDDDRPGFAEVAALVDAGDADVVVVRHVDRLYRKGWRLLRLVDPVAEGGAGWNIYSIQQAFDTSTPEGWFAFAQFALFGDFERRLIGKRTSAALAQLRKEGKHTGRPSLIPVEVEDRIAALHASGLSGSAVARQLMQEGVRRPVKDDRTGEVREVTTWTYEHVLAAVRRAEVRSLV